MKLINSSVDIVKPNGYTINDIYEQIELAGRTCYKSEDKITDTSAKEFVDRMVKSGHNAMLEHGTVYLLIPSNSQRSLDYNINKYSKCNYVLSEKDNTIAVTTNYRVLVENNWLDDLQYLCEPTEYHTKRITAKFICDRGVSHEFVRHRVFSFAQESTRYCNYSKDKFGNELTFIIPSWESIYTANYNGINNFDGDWFKDALHNSEIYYFKLLELGWKPQQARAILPNALKTELVMTGFEDDWNGFFKLRCTPQAHPDARKLALELQEKMIRL